MDKEAKRALILAAGGLLATTLACQTSVGSQIEASITPVAPTTTPNPDNPNIALSMTAVEGTRIANEKTATALSATQTKIAEPPTKTVELSTPIGPITVTVPPTPILTETLSPQQERQEVMGVDEITNWDAEISLQIGLLGTGSDAWFSNLQELEKRGIIKKGDIRTYDKKKELRLGGKYFEFTKANTAFPKAKEVVDEATNIGALVLTQLGYQDIKDVQAKAFGLKIIDMTVNRSTDGQTFWTQNSFPAIVKNIQRSQEPEKFICSNYSPRVKISEEVVAGGILYESNEAPWDLSFSLSPSGFTSKYPGLKTLTIKDASDNTQVLSWRVFDQGSKPNMKAKMKAPTNFENYVWGSEIFKGCGPTSTKAPEQKAPENQAQGGRQPGQPEQPPQPKTEVPPTPVQPTPPIPTPAPTNPGRIDIPTATPS